jgi:hypothetical protein
MRLRNESGTERNQRERAATGSIPKKPALHLSLSLALKSDESSE